MENSKRFLTEEEIKTITDVLKPNKYIPKDVSSVLLANIKNNIVSQLKKISIFPSAIPLLKDQIIKSYDNSLIQPGEMVGTIAASSIGESVTQQSLNSFHSSGAAKVNLTGGLVRQKELLNASKNIKTPSCNIHLDPNAIDIKDLFKVIEFANSNLKYYEFQDLIINYNIYNSGETEFTVEEKNYYNLYSFMNEDINLDSLQNKIRIQFEFDLEKIYKIKKNFETISATIYSILDPEKTNLQIITYPIYTSKIDIWVNNNIQDVETILNLIEKKKSNITITESVKENVNKIISVENMYYKYVKHIVVPSILKIPISGIFGIEECYYSDDKEKNWFIDTKGSNLKEILCNLSINTKKTKSNNMYDIYETFGIDAANTFLIEEFSKIINVNKRHLYLLINSMTISGKIKSVSRYGIDRKQVGPLAKACFEQPVDNFLISATKGEKELLKGVSSTICVGKLGKMGTGMIDLLPDTKKLKKIEIIEPIKSDNQTDDGFY